MKRSVALGMSIMAGAAIVGISYPLLIGLPGSEENVIPRYADKWKFGEGADNNPVMGYQIETRDMKFTAVIHFLPSEETKDGKQKRELLIEIDDPQQDKKFSDKVKLSSAYTFDTLPEEIKPYLKTLDSTIFSVKDIALEEKFLVIDAVWDTTFVGAFSPNIVVTSHKKTTFEFGDLDTYTVSYPIGDKKNEFLVADDLPLPVKATYYDVDGKTLYSYELVSLDADEASEPDE